MKLAGSHLKTLRRIMGNPIPADVRWNEIEGLFKALGAEISEGSGSRVRVALGGVRAGCGNTDHGAATGANAFKRILHDLYRECIS